MKRINTWINLLGIFGVVIGILFLLNIVDITGNSKVTNFNYTDDKFSFSASGNDLAIDKDYKPNNKIYIKFSTNPYSNSSMARDYYNLKVNNSSGQILASYNETNKNGVNIFCSVAEMLEPNSKTPLEFYNFFIQDKNGQVHKICIFGDNSDKKINNTARVVFNSIEIH
jgi:hypothetical protein